MMKFWQVACAILMWKLLELAWSYGFLVMGEREDWTVILIMTLVWLAGSGALWAFFRFFAAAAGARPVPRDER